MTTTLYGLTVAAMAPPALFGAAMAASIYRRAWRNRPRRRRVDLERLRTLERDLSVADRYARHDAMRRHPAGSRR